MSSHSYREVESISTLPGPDESGFISHYVFQYIDFSQVPQYIAAGHRFCDCFFFGCDIPAAMEGQIGSTCLVFPRLGLAYSTFRGKLYTATELYEGYDPEHEDSFATCFDTRVYNDYIDKGKQCNEIRETLGRTLHDRAIEDAMGDFLSRYGERQVVAIMGGHVIKRTDAEYRKVAIISKTLTEKGKLMASGGGPGAMEATHLGAWMAGRTPEEFEEALAMLHHEPATPFATDIAKYFQNSMREDILLTIAKGGIIYTPGSAGTLQEIFQDAAQNHYKTVGLSSPMVFLGVDFFNREVPVYPLLEALLANGRYKDLLLTITDSQDEAVDAIMNFGQ